MITFSILATLLSLLSPTIGNPVPEALTNKGCQSGGLCNGAGTGSPDFSRMCTPQGSGSCNLGAFFTPWSSTGTSTHGWIDWYLFDNKCKDIGGKKRTYPWGSTGGQAPSMGHGWAETVPYSFSTSLSGGDVEITEAVVPDIYGAGWALEFSFAGQKYKNCACSAAAGSGGASGSRFISCGCAFPC